MKAFAPDSAAARGLALCHVCYLATPVSAGRCPRCDSRLHLRLRESLQRTWALTIAAAVLYVPAIPLPVLRVESFGGDRQNTVGGRVSGFWPAGDSTGAPVSLTARVLLPAG